MQFVINELHLLVLTSVGFVYAGIDDAVLSTLVFVLSLLLSLCWASIAFNIGIQKDVVSLALGHSFGVRVTDTYINADLSRVDEANRRVIDYVLYNKK
jgi:hypothetical protein